MSSATFLTTEEVVALTSKTNKPAQVKALLHMGIEHIRRPDGSVAILREHVTKVLGGHSSNGGGRKAKSTTPNWAAL